MSKRSLFVVLGLLASGQPHPLAAQTTQASVAITAPADGARVAGVVTVKATAQGAISVTFRVDGTVVGQDASAPYSLNWDTGQIAVGRHELRVEANGQTGRLGISPPVTITVERSAPANPSPPTAQPTVSITSPAAQAEVTGVVTLTAKASDAITSVRFRVDGTIIGRDTSAPYRGSWDTRDVQPGTHTLVAEGRDEEGKVTTSPTVFVFVRSENRPPNAQATVRITSPASQAEVTGIVTLTATASDAITSVRFRVDGTIVGADTSAPYRQSWDTRDVEAGPHTLVAEGRDAAGDVTKSPAVSVVVIKSENRLPTVTMTAPAGGTTHRAPATILLAATASDPDGSVSRVEFYEASTLLGVDTTAPFTFTWAARGMGTYRLSAHAVDNAGAVATSAAVNVTLTDPSKSSTAVFEPSLDDRAVVRYVLDIFASGVDPEVGAPSASQNLGKPPLVAGEYTADISETLERLRPGTYVATVSAVGSSETARSAPSAPFVIEGGLLSATSIGRPIDAVVESNSPGREPLLPPSSATSTNGILWVTNPSTSMVAAFDAATGDVLAMIPVGLTPTGVAAPAGVGKVYVADEGSDTVSVISKATFNVTATISLPSPAGRKPHHIAASADGRFVYVGELGANVVDVIDTASDAVTARFGAGWPGSTIRGVMPDPSGDLVYAVSAGASPSMSTLVAVNARTGEWLWYLPIPGDANDFVIALDGRTAIVARRDAGTLALIDLERRSVVDELDLGAGNAAGDIQLSADGRLLVITLQQTPDRVGIVDLTGSDVVRIVAVGTVPARSSIPEAHRSYVRISETTTGAAGIVAIDAPSQTLIGRFRFPGGGTPHSAVFDPQ